MTSLKPSLFYTSQHAREPGNLHNLPANMRLIKQNIERDGSGTITLFPEEPEDMVSSEINVSLFLARLRCPALLQKQPACLLHADD